jgi:hypothetical protein
VTGKASWLLVTVKSCGTISHIAACEEEEKGLTEPNIRVRRSYAVVQLSSILHRRSQNTLHSKRPVSVRVPAVLKSVKGRKIVLDHRCTLREPKRRACKRTMPKVKPQMGREPHHVIRGCRLAASETMEGHAKGVETTNKANKGRRKVRKNRAGVKDIILDDRREHGR